MISSCMLSATVQRPRRPTIQGLVLLHRSPPWVPMLASPEFRAFEGYIFAVTSFQYCHGFAFIQTRDNGLAEGYLPLVVDEGRKTGSRRRNTGCLRASRSTTSKGRGTLPGTSTTTNLLS